MLAIYNSILFFVCAGICSRSTINIILTTLTINVIIPTSPVNHIVSCTSSYSFVCIGSNNTVSIFIPFIVIIWKWSKYYLVAWESSAHWKKISNTNRLCIIFQSCDRNRVCGSHRIGSNDHNHDQENKKDNKKSTLSYRTSSLHATPLFYHSRFYRIQSMAAVC